MMKMLYISDIDGKLFRIDIPDGGKVTLRIDGNDLYVTPDSEEVQIIMLVDHKVSEGHVTLR